MYSIGEVSEITRISRDRLRNYEQKGILNPVKNADNGYREYSIDDIDRVLLIEYYRSLDLGIDQIREICEGGSTDDIRRVAEEKRQSVELELRRLNRIRANIDSFL